MPLTSATQSLRLLGGSRENIGFHFLKQLFSSLNLSLFVTTKPRGSKGVQRCRRKKRRIHKERTLRGMCVIIQFKNTPKSHKCKRTSHKKLNSKLKLGTILFDSLLCKLSG